MRLVIARKILKNKVFLAMTNTILKIIFYIIQHVLLFVKWMWSQIIHLPSQMNFRDPDVMKKY